MSWLTEDPLWLMTCGLVVTAIFYGLTRFHSRKTLFRRLTIVALAFTLSGTVFEQLYVTDRERLKSTIYSLANGVEANDSQKVIRHVSETRPEMIQRISDEMAHLRFDECSIISIDAIKINPSSQEQAAIEFQLFVNIDAREKYMCRAKGTRQVRFHFEKEPDLGWRLVGCVNLPLQGITSAVSQLTPTEGALPRKQLPRGFEFNPPSHHKLEINF